MSPACQGLRLRRVLVILASSAWLGVVFSMSEQDRHAIGNGPDLLVTGELNGWPARTFTSDAQDECVTTNAPPRKAEADG